MLKFFYLALLFFLLSIPINALVIAGKILAIVRYDTSNIRSRTFNTTALNNYKSQKDFQYDSSSYQPGESLWDRFWRWFWSFFTKTLVNSASGSIMKYISITIAIAIILFVIIKFAGITHIFTGKPVDAELFYSESLENIHKINFDTEIQVAVNKLNYRLAVRLLYLKCLKKLSDSGIISWQINKTNSAYINELHNSGKQQQFAFLTRQFEYVWYGECHIDKTVFQQIYNSFQGFNNGL